MVLQLYKHYTCKEFKPGFIYIYICIKQYYDIESKCIRWVGGQEFFSLQRVSVWLKFKKLFFKLYLHHTVYLKLCFNHSENVISETFKSNGNLATQQGSLIFWWPTLTSNHLCLFTKHCGNHACPQHGSY